MAIISKPYILTKRNLTSIEKDDLLEWDGKCSALKNHIKEDYCIKQRKKCAYCNTELESKCNGSHIDHIVPRYFKPIWTYEPINLCLSCEQCNTKKSDQNTLSNLSLYATIPPRMNLAYTIIHAHFDDWNDHLFYEDGFFITFQQNSNKGQNTIGVCGLYRHLYIERRLRQEYTEIVDRIEVLRIKQLEIGLTPVLKQEIDNCIDELLKYLD